MAEPALRSFAVAGVLAATVVFSGIGVAPALAQPSDSGSTSQDSGDTGGGSEPSGGDSTPSDPAGSDEPADSGPAEEPDSSEVTGGDDAGPTEPDKGGDSSGRQEAPAESPPPPPAPVSTTYNNSIRIPFFRLPAAGEIPAGSWPSVSTFYTTVEIPVPSLKEFLRSLSFVPTPSPAPGPAFRTQEEAPVADATTGTTGGGGGGGGGAMSEPVVFRAPLVTVPRAVTIAGKPPRATPGAPGAPVGPGITQPGAAGVRTPVIRGSVPPTPGVSTAPAATPMGTQTTAGAYPRGVMNPTMAELAAVALPGVAGLLFLTFGGGMIGYRQANSVRYVRTAGAERFLP